MKNKVRSIAVLIITVCCIGLVSPVIFAAQEAKSTEYICPPCGCDSDNEKFDKPGTCPSCGMPMVKKGTVFAPPPPPVRKEVAILIFDGVQIIDYTGPYEVFGQAQFNVFTVAKSSDPLTTAMGMKVTPSFTFDNSPEPNILVIPGGNVLEAQRDPVVLKWIKDRSEKAEYVMSVCNGAYILARTGLLDGLTATTFYGLIDGLVPIAPKTKIVRDRRFVDNGKIITTAGLSSGIDGSLHLLSKIFGRGRAQAIALNLEYDWRPDGDYARAALADLRMGFNYGNLDALSLSREGGRDQWENRWLVKSEKSAADLLEQINEAFVTQGHWTKTSSDNTNGATSLWRFTDGQGQAWKGLASIETLAGEKNRYLMIVRISRGDLKEVVSNNPSNIVIKDAWIQEPPSQTSTAAFLTIENQGPMEVALISAHVAIAGATELHKMVSENNLMSMRRVDVIPVASGDSTGMNSTTGYHIMLINLNRPIKEGEQIQLTLQFSNSARKTITVPVKKRASESAAITEK